ncbi:DUF6879 family protein [Streptomyces sp. NPDC058398]|uniref:DUF6879 family protein n=1 Tax=Streptomyces sp. NPDC058398 TaxID=3346479 RepID=UPI003648A5D5
MELISSAERNLLFARYKRDAFHLELRDDYSVPDEDTPFRNWLSGRDSDHSYLAPWIQLVRQCTRRGMTIRRVRVVTEPVTPYIQWEHALTALNAEAGEDIRWLPRHLLPQTATFPLDGRDWWLFDDQLLAVGHFDTDGRVLGSQLILDQDAVVACAALRDQLWTAAIPHTAYKP